MSENDATAKKQKEKKPIQMLRERRGGVPKELIERNREQVKIRKALTKALEAGPRTVPEISRITGIPSHEVLWYLIGLKKYGKVIEGEEREGYYEYALKEGEEVEK